MDLDEFKDFLSRETKVTSKGIKTLTENSINARLSRANRLERELNINLDEKVENKEKLRELKVQIKQKYSDKVAAALYNTATRYYKFKHGEEPEMKYKDFLKV